MNAKTYLQISALNLLFLIVGVAIGATAVLVSGSAHAQDAKVAEKPATDNCDATKFDCVSPNISSGTALFGILISNRIGADRLEVNGYEPLKLHEKTLQLLARKGLLTGAEIEQIISTSKAEKPLRLKSPRQ